MLNEGGRARKIENRYAVENVGASNNSRSLWRRDDRGVIDWAPRDSSDDQADRVRGRATTDAVAERFQRAPS